MLKDYEFSGTTERDSDSCSRKILELHDLAQDPAAGTADQLSAGRCVIMKIVACIITFFDDRNSRETLRAVGLSVAMVNFANQNILRFYLVVPSTCDETFADIIVVNGIRRN